MNIIGHAMAYVVLESAVLKLRSKDILRKWMVLAVKTVKEKWKSLAIKYMTVKEERRKGR